MFDIAPIEKTDEKLCLSRYFLPLLGPLSPSDKISRSKSSKSVDLKQPF